MYKLGMYLFAVFDNFEFSLWRDVEVASRVALPDDESTGRNLEQIVNVRLGWFLDEDLVMSGRLGKWQPRKYTLKASFTFMVRNTELDTLWMSPMFSEMAGQNVTNGTFPKTSGPKASTYVGYTVIQILM